MPNLYIFAGLPDVLGVLEFVNADEIARGLSPFNVEGVAFEAGRIMLQRIDFLINRRVDFAFEMTLSTRSYVHLIRQAKESGYFVSLYYFWIPSADVSKERVAMRVLKGGHDIPTDVIERRYGRSVLNLTKLYIPICDYFAIFNNTELVPEMVATGGIDVEFNVLNEDIWKTILRNESKSDETETE